MAVRPEVIAGWLLQRGNGPLSPDPGPPLLLQAN
jgi:cell division protein FtsI (penicillin-binding protein 3)